MSERPLRIGLAGLGTVGSGLARLLAQEKEWLRRRLGRDIAVASVLERNQALRGQGLVSDDVPFMSDIQAFAADPRIDAVVELIGGLEAAGAIIRTALESGKHVVTANKALLAQKGRELFRLAAERQLHLCYEASVAGGVPIVRALKSGMAGNRVESIQGILNGTANFILTQMSEAGLDFSSALRQAQERGFAEADPTLDIEGGDSAHKLQLLIRLAFGLDYPLEDLPVRGISELSDMDISFAAEFGYVIKLIAEAQLVGNEVEAGVFPALVCYADTLSSVEGSFNAVRLGGAAGPILLHGYGAGSLPTASAVLSDLMVIARGVAPDNTGFAGHADLPPARPLSPDRNISAYYFRMMVPDEPGVLAKLAGAMGRHNISIAQMVQKAPSAQLTSALIVFLTHKALARDVREALADIEGQNLLKAPPVCLRIL